jgi:hypothetical protein
MVFKDFLLLQQRLLWQLAGYSRCLQLLLSNGCHIVACSAPDVVVEMLIVSVEAMEPDGLECHIQVILFVCV